MARIGWRKVAGCVVVLVASALGPAAAVHAQPGRGGGGGGGWGGQMFQPPVASTELDRYADILGLDADQRAAAVDLLAGHMAGFQDEARVIREKIDALREEARETRDPEIWREMRDHMTRLNESRQTAEKAFFDDYKLLLTDEQSERWPRVERTRRRETTAGRGFLSGERLDLVRLVERAELPEGAKADVQEILERYEIDLDRALVKRNELFESGMRRGRELFEAGDMETIQKLFEEGRAASMAVRDLNMRYARQIELVLPVEEQPKFGEMIRREAYPLAYRPFASSRALESAGALEDLDDSQRAALEDVRLSLERNISAWREKAIKATVDMEESMTLQTLMQRGRGQDGGPLGELRTERRDLDREAMRRIEQVLTEAQRARVSELRGEEEDDQERGPGFRGTRRGEGAGRPQPPI